MVNLSEDLSRALESDCASSLSEIIARNRQEDFDAFQDLLATDADVNQEYLAKAVYALGRWGNPAAVDSILRSLDSLNELGRISAVDALGRLGTEAALSGVMDCANDDSPQVRKFAAIALKSFNNSVARAKLQEMISQEPIDFVRQQAAKSANSN